MIAALTRARLLDLELRRARLCSIAESTLLAWIAAENATGRRSRDRALDDVSRWMVALAAELERHPGRP